MKPFSGRPKRFVAFPAALGGLAAWLLFILACTGWPSWSPDGNKILFPFIDPRTEVAGIALFDRSSGTVSAVLNQASPDKDSAPLPFAQWSANGKQAIISLVGPGEDERQMTTQVLVLPLGSHPAVRSFTLSKTSGLLLPPWPQVGNELLMGSDHIVRLNLESSVVEIKPIPEGKGIHLIPGGDRLWYVLYDIERAGKEGKGQQFGEFNPKDLSLRPLFEIWDVDQSRLGFSDLDIGTMSAEPAGPRLAAAGKVGDDPALLLFGPAGLERIVKPQFPSKNFRLGRVIWSADHKVLYTAAVGPGATEGTTEFMVAEVSLADGLAGITGIAGLSSKSSIPEFALQLQISLSPDGRTLAANLASADKDWLADPEDRALFLVDLRDPAHRTTRHSLPWLAPKASAGK